MHGRGQAGGVVKIRRADPTSACAFVQAYGDHGETIDTFLGAWKVWGHAHDAITIAIPADKRVRKLVVSFQPEPS